MDLVRRVVRSSPLVVLLFKLLTWRTGVPLQVVTDPALASAVLRKFNVRGGPAVVSTLF